MDLRLGIFDEKLSDEEQICTLSDCEDNCCHFCGFKSEKFQEVIKCGNENYVACSFCYQTLNLLACARRRAGYLIYLPEFTQAELNHMLRAIYVARSSDNSNIANKARKCFDVLSSRRTVAEDILGTDDPKILAEIINSFMSDEERNMIPEKLKGIRLMSLDKKIEVEDGMEFNEFPQMLNYWKSNVDFLKQPCSTWNSIEEVLDKEIKEEKTAEEEVNVNE